MSVPIKICRVSDDAHLPDYAHEGDAGADLYALEGAAIMPGERKLIRTGIKISIPMGYEVQTRPKSGLALKHGISLVNTPGTIDAGYRGEVGIILINHGQEPYEVKKGTKIAQMIVSKVEHAVFEEVKELDETKRSDGGFGSTGEVKRCP